MRDARRAAERGSVPDPESVRAGGRAADPGLGSGPGHGLGVTPAVVWRTRPVGATVAPEDWARLSPDERARASGLAQPAPQARFVVSRALLRETLAEVLPEIDARACRIAPSGPPRLEGGAANLSLAHTDGLVAVAVSPRWPVGIDVERLVRDADVAVRSWSTPSERAGLAEDPSVRRSQLLHLWTAKEAVIKAFGARVRDPVDVTRSQIEVHGARRSAEVATRGYVAQPADRADGGSPSRPSGPGTGTGRPGALEVHDDRVRHLGVGSVSVQGRDDAVSIAWEVVDERYLVALAVGSPPIDDAHRS
jgi:4'-phosphopantetheinyl transferase